METVKEMIRGKPIRGNLGKPMSTVFVVGKGVYRLNATASLRARLGDKDAYTEKQPS